MAAQNEEVREGTSRALVAAGIAAPRSARAGRPHPSIVAQLLAAKLDLPESRRRRRAAPEAAAEAYETARACLAAAAPVRLRRSA